MFKIVDIELFRIDQKTCDPANKNFSKIEHRIAKLSRETFDEAGGGIVVEVVSNTNSLLISNPR